MLLLGPKNGREFVAQYLDIVIDGCHMPLSNSAKNLGVSIDTDLSFEIHVKNLLQKAHFKLKCLYQNRHLFNSRLKKLLCDSLILSNFTFCDLLYGSCITKELQTRIQRMQNSCLRFIYCIRKREHISHTLRWANWLNMHNRYVLHGSVLVHKILCDKKPSYLYRRIKFRTDIHAVNIRRKDTLHFPSHRLQLFKKSFSYVCCKLYNAVPSQFKTLTVGTFKSSFKKYLHSGQTSGL